jgi:hypothetical protein
VGAFGEKLAAGEGVHGSVDRGVVITCSELRPN